MLAALFAAGAGHALATTVVLKAGGPAVSVDLGVDVRGGGVGTPSLVWTRTGDHWTGTAHGAAWDVTVSLAPADAALALDVLVRYAAATAVDHEVVRLGLPGAARAVGRDLDFASVGERLRVDRGTPVFVATPRVAVAGGQGIVAAEVVPGHDRTELALILDDRASHPFSVYEQCLPHLPPPPVDWRALEKRRPHDALMRPAGAEVRARATLHLPGAGAPLPLIVERWPAGARAALVVTDHADRTDPAALRAVLFGSSDARAPATRGLYGHGLQLTKTFFARGGTGTLADDAAARALADEIVARGGEVGAHSITDHVDTRAEVQDGLATFDPWHVVTWIDHEPYTNCEALSTDGWGTAPPFGIRDLLVAHGYRWAWAADDVGEEALDLFEGGPAAARSPIFPFPPDPRLWVFRSALLYDAPGALAARLDDRALDALEAHRGLIVAHTYLSASERTTGSPDHRRRLAVRRTAAGTLEVAPALDALFARLGARVAAGSLVVPTWHAVGDRLRALGDVTIEYRGDGSAAVVNHGTDAIADVTLAAPVAGAALVADGVAGRRAEAGRSLAWRSLAAGERVIVRAARAGEPLPFVSGTPVTVEIR